jgi:hypothetical protein
MRATVKAMGLSSVEPSKSEVSFDGSANSTRPVIDSRSAVEANNFFIGSEQSCPTP